MGVFGRTVASLAVVSLVGLAGCSAGVTADDVYRVGCPAVDTVAGGGTLVGKASVKGLQQLYDSKTLGADAQRWLGNAITFLRSGDPKALPAGARSEIVKGCAAHGYPLTNLR